jgi:hypothetical protein
MALRTPWDTKGQAMNRKLSSFEEKLMFAMGLEDVAQLNELLAAPTSQDAADHSAPPDEEYELADRMCEEDDRQREAQQRFGALTECTYVN